MTEHTDNPLLERELPIERIHPDPFQPRIHPDAELADSIASQGILQAIRVEPAQPLDAICEHCDMTFVDLAALGDWMIQDGERRYRGAIAAGFETILAKIVEPATETVRLVRQLTSNTGKPLTPIEEAFAFKRIMDDQGWSQVELAKQLGRPRSVIGDRIRLVELHPVWLKLIESGRLQVSHGPILSQFREVPAEYQEKAAKNITDGEGWQMRRFKDEAEAVIPVADFRRIAFGAFRDFIIKLADVRSYKGPVLEIEEEHYTYGSKGSTLKRVKYAADIKLWRPIKREADKRRKKAQASSGNSGGYRREKSHHEADVDALEKIGVTVEKVTGYGEVSAKKGEARVFNSSGGWPEGWRRGEEPFDAATFIERVDPTKLVIRKGQYSTGEVFTTDRAAVDAAREKWQSLLDQQMAPIVKTVKRVVEKAIPECSVSGPGAQFILSVRHNNYQVTPLPILAKALDIDLAKTTSAGAGGSTDDDDEYDENTVSSKANPKAKQADVERLASAYLAFMAGKVEIPNQQLIDGPLHKRNAKVRFTIKTATPLDAKAAAKAESKAKGQELGKKIAIARKNAAKAPVESAELEEAMA